MKKKFLAYSTGLIKQHYPETDDTQMEIYRYNLEGFYLTITKALIIIPLAILCGIIKEFLLLIVTYNIIRAQSHGLHATKSWICLLSSTIIFIGMPLLAKVIYIPLYLKIIINVIGLLLMGLYAPADTKKAPIIKKENRRKFKIKSIIYTLLIAILSIVIKDSTISNLLIFAIWIAVVLILPITYRIFNLSYNNYVEYLKNMN